MRNFLPLALTTFCLAPVSVQAETFYLYFGTYESKDRANKIEASPSLAWRYLEARPDFCRWANSPGGEQDLRWHAIYRLYADLYESRLEDFLASHGCDLDEFVAACRDALAHSTWQEHRGLATCILSMAEYDYFITMMADAAEDAANPVDYTDVRRAPVVLGDDDDAPPSQPGDELDGEFM